MATVTIRVDRETLKHLVDALQQSRDFAEIVRSLSDYDEGMAAWREAIAEYAEELVSTMTTVNH